MRETALNKWHLYKSFLCNITFKNEQNFDLFINMH